IPVHPFICWILLAKRARCHYNRACKQRGGKFIATTVIKANGSEERAVQKMASLSFPSVKHSCWPRRRQREPSLHNKPSRRTHRDRKMITGHRKRLRTASKGSSPPTRTRPER
ncbi:hypothetical protein SFRURICE_011910, partial [Spodoptera frugiperda]